VFKPKVLQSLKQKKPGIQLTMGLSMEEARQLASELQIQGSLETVKTKRELSEKAKAKLLSLLKPKRAKRP